MLIFFEHTEKSSVPFAGITMIFVGDLYQLPPVLQKPIYADYYDEIFNIHHLWRTFKSCELTEVMRQREDSLFIDLLNNVLIGELSESDINVLGSRVIDKADKNYPVDALHIFAENEPARVHNQTMLETIDQTVLTIEAIDQVPICVPNHIYDRILNMSLSQTMENKLELFYAFIIRTKKLKLVLSNLMILKLDLKESRVS